MSTEYDNYEPPWHTWSSENWDEYFAMGGETCLLCDERVDDRNFAVAVETHRAWVPSASSVAFAHVECLRKAIPRLVRRG
jgi:hypothetical protein